MKVLLLSLSAHTGSREGKKHKQRRKARHKNVGGTVHLDSFRTADAISLEIGGARGLIDCGLGPHKSHFLPRKDYYLWKYVCQP